jgi:formylglycine-generating enzyme required for sulfatase activity
MDQLAHMKTPVIFCALLFMGLFGCSKPETSPRSPVEEPTTEGANSPANEAAQAAVKPVPPTKPVSGKSYAIPDLELDMLWCKPGTFLMGSPVDEKGRKPDETLHEVTLTQGFWLGKYEVTQEQWNKVMGTNPSRFKGSSFLTLSSTQLNAASWTVTHLTGDSDSGVSSELVYTCAVNVHGTEDKVVNGVTFKAESGTSGQGWEISQNFQTQHNGETSTVGGKIGEVLSNRMRFNGDPQKLKMTGLTPGETYVFTLYNQAFSVGETRTATLSLDAADETLTVNQDEYSSMSQDGLLVQCEYVADDTDVEFTLDPQTVATWHLYGFSNAVSPRLHPSFHLDHTNPSEPVATLEWKAGTSGFTVDDISVVNGTISDFQVISPTKQTFKLTLASDTTTISVSIEAARLKIDGEDNDAFTRSIQHGILPVEQVTWRDAMTFCEKLTAQEKAAGRLPKGWVTKTGKRMGGKAYTLPTESQWEYACRAGTTTAYSFGDTIPDKQANFHGKPGKTTPVGNYPANPWGFHDLHGNVWEWCLDLYGGYPVGPARDPIGPSTGKEGILRGGSWNYDGNLMRSACRDKDPQRNRHSILGFRLSLQRE